MFQITQDPSPGSDNLYLIEITYNGSVVLIMCVVGVWRHVLHLWCVCALWWPESFYCTNRAISFLSFREPLSGTGLKLW